MRPLREWNLAVAWLLIGIALGIPAQCSPTTPKQPSVLNFQPLNVVPCPSTETEWSFEVSHLDMVVASDHLSGLRSRNSDAALLSYQLVHSVLVSDTTEQNQLASIAAAQGKDVEDGYLHYYDDTTLTYSNGQKVTIKGYGGGTATTLKEARVRNYIWTDERYIYNLRSTLVSQLKGTQFRSVMTSTLHPDGIFVDENSPLQAFLAPATAGGHIREYGNKDREAAAADWLADMTPLFASINEAMGHDGTFGERYLMPNCSEYVDMFMDLATKGADGQATEVLVQEGQPRSPRLYDQAKQLADAGKIFLVTQGSYYPVINSVGNYGSAMDRHQMFGLCEYWIARQGNSTYYSQYPPDYVAASTWWCKARDYDIGLPTDSLYSVWKTGTDSKSQSYTIYKRTYGKALVLSRPQVGWNYTDYSTLCSPYDLGGTYRLLHYDGTLGPEITSIGLAMGEAVCLIRVTTDTADTTPPVISNVTATGATATSANVGWSTNEQATGSVEYGTTTSYGSSVSTASLATGQTITISNLAPGTTYHYRVTATDFAGNKTVGTDSTFTTVQSSDGGGSTTGFIRNWAILGSFGYSGTGHNTDFVGGETTIRPSVGDTTAGLTWIGYASPTDKVDITSLFSPYEHAIAYMNVYVNSPTDKACQLRFAVDDAAKVYLNGTLVDDNTGYLSPDPDTDKIDVTLKAGWNQLLVKAENFTVLWTLYARFTDSNGTPLSGLTYQLNNPAPATGGTPKVGLAITVDKQTAKVGDQLTYTVSYTNTGDGTATSAVLTANVDSHVNFVSATGGGTYDSQTRTVKWSVGSIAPGATGVFSYTAVVQ